MQKAKTKTTEYDYVIVGSGFGGSVSALRLSQKGYKVLVIEKGQWFHDQSYAKSAWNLRRWLWLPRMGLRGIMQISVFKHVTVYSGVGVGGGSLTYGATLPTPKRQFFESGSWAKLQAWEKVLAPFYQQAIKMLGATPNPHLTDSDQVIAELAERLGKGDEFHPTRVGVFFSDPNAQGRWVEDPYFEGDGPKRKGCIQCGSCMTGCPHNAKNTLDKNYLYLAQQHGSEILAEHEVMDVQPSAAADGRGGYFVSFKSSRPYAVSTTDVVFSKGIIFSGGVLGTVPLLLKLKDSGSLPRLSKQLGADIRTNNETLAAVTSFRDDLNFAQGVSIGSVLHTDEHSHVEPINHNNRSGLMRLFIAPTVEGRNLLRRAASFIKLMLTEPKANLKVLFARDWGQRTMMLLFMQHLDSTLAMTRGWGGRINTALGQGAAPSRHIPESAAITRGVEQIVQGKSSTGMTEALLGTPSTAHILGGAVMGKDPSTGVVDDKCAVHGYHNMYVCDGSAVSANPGVNPSLSITAISEWAMSHIANKASTDEEDA